MKNSQSKPDYSWIYFIAFCFICFKVNKCRTHEQAHKIMKDPKLRREWDVKSLEEAEEAIDEAESNDDGHGR